MDRRTTLAMVLFFALFLVWSKLYVKWYGPRPGATAGDSTAVAASAPGDSATDAVMEATAARSESQVPAGPDAGATANPAPAVPAADPLAFVPAPEGELVVRNHRFLGVVSTRSAQVVSWRCLEYPGVDGQPVQLVPRDSAETVPPAGDTVLFERGALDLTGAPFRLEGPAELDLSDSSGPVSVTLVAETEGGVTVRKTLTFHPGRFDVAVEYSVIAPPAVQELYGQPTAVRFAWRDGIAVTEPKIKAVMRAGVAGFRAVALVGEELYSLPQSKLAKMGKAGQTHQGTLRFAAVQNKYFSIAGFLPRAAERVVEGKVRLGGDPETLRQSWAVERPLTPADDGGWRADFAMYLGPNRFQEMKRYGAHLEKAVNLGWKWLKPLSELVLVMMNWLYRFIPNYGWVIVIISLLSKLIFYPLTAKGTRAMRKMQESQARLKPKMDALKKRYGDDPKRYNEEMMKLYREEGVNPMAGMAGCLPMLIQMPVFLALYQVLYNMVDLRMAPWILWIKDLSQPDALFTLPFSLPLLGSSFNLLPLVMAAVTVWQMRLTPQSGAGGQMAAMNTMMPIMMLIFLYNMPSGLVIYWTINTAVTGYQTWRINQTAAA